MASSSETQPDFAATLIKILYEFKKDITAAITIEDAKFDNIIAAIMIEDAKFDNITRATTIQDAKYYNITATVSDQDSKFSNIKKQIQPLTFRSNKNPEPLNKQDIKLSSMQVS